MIIKQKRRRLEAVPQNFQTSAQQNPTEIVDTTKHLGFQIHRNRAWRRYKKGGTFAKLNGQYRTLQYGKIYLPGYNIFIEALLSIKGLNNFTDFSQVKRISHRAVRILNDRNDNPPLWVSLFRAVSKHRRQQKEPNIEYFLCFLFKVL